MSIKSLQSLPLNLTCGSQYENALNATFGSLPSLLVLGKSGIGGGIANLYYLECFHFGELGSIEGLEWADIDVTELLFLSFLSLKELVDQRGEISVVIYETK